MIIIPKCLHSLDDSVALSGKKLFVSGIRFDDAKGILYDLSKSVGEKPVKTDIPEAVLDAKSEIDL
jgi:hypothetical protein